MDQIAWINKKRKIKNKEISREFIIYAAAILADTNSGYSGSQIVKITSQFAIKYNVDLPHNTYPFGMCNKMTALADNLNAFEDSSQVFMLLKYMSKELGSKNSQELYLELIRTYGHLDTNPELNGVSTELIEQTKHWLAEFPEVLEVFNSAIQKQSHGLFKRNLIDDLRLSLELLIKSLLDNDKSLENQLPLLGQYLNKKGGSKEVTNMLSKLLDYYTKYQNSYVKHDDAVNELEIEIMCELTASFMKHMIRLDQ